MKSGKVLFFSEDNILYFKKQNIQDLYFSVPLKKIENFSEILDTKKLAIRFNALININEEKDYFAQIFLMCSKDDLSIKQEAFRCLVNILDALRRSKTVSEKEKK